MSAGTLVGTLHAHDVDEGLGGEIKYEILDEGDAFGMLHLNQKTGELTTKISLTAKGRPAPYEIIVRALDNGDQIPNQNSLHTDVQVTFYIGDVCGNDGVPMIIAPQAGEDAFVYEVSKIILGFLAVQWNCFTFCTQNATVGTFVTKILASDPDSPLSPSGTIVYRMQKEHKDSSYFDIDATTGVITTAKALDREKQDSYIIIIEVSDLGLPVQVASKVLHTNVLDIDDHPPIFERQLYEAPIEMEIFEEKPSGTFVGLLQAIDKDIGENGQIDYAIVDGDELNYFNISRKRNNSAVIVTTQPIDKEMFDSFLLTVKCFKLTKDAYRIQKPFEREDFSEILVKIYIRDIDDHLPEFVIEETIGVRYNVPTNMLITTVTAVDVDSSALPINITIQDVKFVSQFHRKQKPTSNDLKELFFIVKDELRSAKLLHEYVDGYFEILIRANNSNHPLRYKETLLKVYIIREKSLLRFVFSKTPREVFGFLEDFRKKITNELEKKGLDIAVFDAQILHHPENNLDYSSASSCFSMARNGAQLNLHDMQKILESDSVHNSLLELYLNYSVTKVESCASHIIQESKFSSGSWLVVLVGAIGLASMTVLISAHWLLNR